MGKTLARKTSVSTRSNSSQGTRQRSDKKEKSPKPPPVSTLWCAACEQRSNEEDRDAPPGEKIKVVWPESRLGHKVPQGQECYPCFYVRRKFWADRDQEALNTLLEGDSNEKDTHAELRRATLCLPTGWCVTCDQGWNCQDRDAPPGKEITVKWAKFWCDRFGRNAPKGKECYPCFDVRRKFWADKNQKALNTLLKHNSDEKDTHAEARRAKVCEDKRYKSKEEIKFTITQTKAVLDQRFVEGSFVPLRKYASQQRLDASETVLDTDLANTVMEQTGTIVKRCEVSGELGIERFDVAADGGYRFRRGIDQSVTMQTGQEFDDKNQCQLEFELLTTMMGGNPIVGDDSLDPGLHPCGLQHDSVVSSSDIDPDEDTSEPGKENGEGNEKSVPLTEQTLEKFGLLAKASCKKRHAKSLGKQSTDVGSHVSERNSAVSDSQSSNNGKGGEGKGKGRAGQGRQKGQGKGKGREGKGKVRAQIRRICETIPTKGRRKGRPRKERAKEESDLFFEFLKEDFSPETQAMVLKEDNIVLFDLISEQTAGLAERIVAEDKEAANVFAGCLSSTAEGYTALTLKSVGFPAEQMARIQINAVRNLTATILKLNSVSVIINAVTLLFSFLPPVTSASLLEIGSKDPHLIGAGLTTVCLAAELFETDSV